ncbi:MAG: DoxX family protein [Thermoplasmatota archaeon]
MEPTDIAFVIGRVLLGGYFVMAGFNHFKGAKMMAGYAQSKGVPVPMLAVLGSGALLFVGGLSILTGFYPYVGLALVALFLVGVTPKMHDFWNVEDPMQRMGEQVNFTKNAGLFGATLALYAVATPWVWGIA